MSEASLRERLNRDLRESLRSQDEVRKTTIRMLLASVHNAEIQAGRALDDRGIEAVAAREVKQRRESAEEYRKAGREDLVAREEAEIAVLSEYMPRQMTRDEIRERARAVIERIGAQGPAAKGKVMPVLITELRGQADGAEINAVVSELLANP